MKILNAWISPGGTVFHVEPGEHSKFAQMWLCSNDEELPSINEAFDEELVHRGWKILSQREGGPLFVLPRKNCREWPVYQERVFQELLKEYGIEKGAVQ